MSSYVIVCTVSDYGGLEYLVKVAYDRMTVIAETRGSGLAPAVMERDINGVEWNEDTTKRLNDLIPVCESYDGCHLCTSRVIIRDADGEELSQRWWFFDPKSSEAQAVIARRRRRMDRVVAENANTQPLNKELYNRLQSVFFTKVRIRRIPLLMAHRRRK